MKCLLDEKERFINSHLDKKTIHIFIEKNIVCRTKIKTLKS